MQNQLGLSYKGKKDEQIESNAKVVEWSDGTKSLVIGDQIFEI